MSKSVNRWQHGYDRRRGVPRNDKTPWVTGFYRCGREDSNLHGINSHKALNLARLPVSPRPLLSCEDVCLVAGARVSQIFTRSQRPDAGLEREFSTERRDRPIFRSNRYSGSLMVTAKQTSQRFLASWRMRMSATPQPWMVRRQASIRSAEE